MRFESGEITDFEEYRIFFFVRKYIGQFKICMHQILFVQIVQSIKYIFDHLVDE